VFFIFLKMSQENKPQNQLYSKTQNFKLAVEDLNKLDPATLKSLLESMIVPDSTIPDHLKDTSEFIKHLVERAAQVRASPKQIVDELVSLIQKELLKPILKYYDYYNNELEKKLQRSPVVPHHLDDVQWRLHLKLGESEKEKILTPTSFFQFSLTDPKGENEEDFTLEFDHDELYSFFNYMEDIQQQLDDLL